MQYIKIFATVLAVPPVCSLCFYCFPFYCLLFARLSLSVYMCVFLWCRRGAHLSLPVSWCLIRKHTCSPSTHQPAVYKPWLIQFSPDCCFSKFCSTCSRPLRIMCCKLCSSYFLEVNPCFSVPQDHCLLLPASLLVPLPASQSYCHTHHPVLQLTQPCPSASSLPSTLSLTACYPARRPSLQSAYPPPSFPCLLPPSAWILTATHLSSLK